MDPLVSPEEEIPTLLLQPSNVKPQASPEYYNQILDEIAKIKSTRWFELFCARVRYKYNNNIDEVLNAEGLSDEMMREREALIGETRLVKRLVHEFFNEIIEEITLEQNAPTTTTPITNVNPLQ